MLSPLRGLPQMRREGGTGQSRASGFSAELPSVRPCCPAVGAQWHALFPPSWELTHQVRSGRFWTRRRVWVGRQHCPPGWLRGSANPRTLLAKYFLLAQRCSSFPADIHVFCESLGVALWHQTCCHSAAEPRVPLARAFETCFAVNAISAEGTAWSCSGFHPFPLV